MSGHHKSNVMAALKKYQIGPYQVLGFKTIHDTQEPFGFVISHPESGVIVFITDTVYSPFKFKNVSNWIVEANYSFEIMDGKDGYGAQQSFLRNRVISSHLSLENAISLLKANDLSKTNNIVLIHLSDRNSHAKQFKEEVEKQTGKSVFIAENGLSIPFGARPF